MTEGTNVPLIVTYLGCMLKLDAPNGLGASVRPGQSCPTTLMTGQQGTVTFSQGSIIPGTTSGVLGLGGTATLGARTCGLQWVAKLAR